MISFPCPGCARVLKVQDELAGKKVKCPQCGRVALVPATAPSETTPIGKSAARPAPLGPEAKTLPPRPSEPDASALTLPPGAAAAADSDTAGDVPGRHAEGPEPEWTSFLAPPRGPGEIGWLGPYRVLKVLGAGGMGVVYHAEDPHLQRPVALKAMLPALGASDKARQRFLREARAAAGIKHPHIVTIYQVGEDRGAPFLAMEFLEGQPLDGRLRQEDPLPTAEVLRIGREIAEGLAAAHDRGLIHRDIKPANVWLEGPGAWVKILDFGLARAVREEQQLTQQGAVVGTPAYMAPEQAGGQEVSFRCDLFSLGCLLYRISTGQLPFHGRDTIATLMAVATAHPLPPRQVNRQVPAALSDLIMHLLAKQPEERPASARAVVEVLRAIEGTHEQATLPPAPARRSKPAAPAGKAPPRRAWLWAAGAAGVLVAVTAGALVLLNRGGDSLPQPEAKKEQPAPTPKDKKPPPMLACAADALRHEGIPADKLAWAGNGNPANAPAELVAVLKETYMTGAISPDGKTLAVGMRDGEVKLRDLATGKEQTLAGKHRFSILSVRFSPDGKRLATSAGDGDVKLWDVAAAKEERTVVALGFNNFPRIAFSPDGETLAVGSFQSGKEKDGNKLQLFAVTGAALPVTLAENAPAAVFLMYNPVGHRLFTAPPVKVWDTARGKLERTLKYVSYPSSLDVSPDGKTLACTYSADPDVRLRSATTGEAGPRLRGEGHMSQAVFSPDGSRVAAVSAVGIHLWDVATGKEVKTIKMAVPGLGRGQMFFTPEGRHLVTFSPGGDVCIFRLHAAR
jgi:serine/threonine protein kinase